MAHELMIQNGEASMMYVGDPPWHGMGTALKKPATAKEAICAAKLDWTVEKRSAYYFHANSAMPIPDKFAVVPADGWEQESRPAFGIVSKSFKLLQNREAFSFFDPIVGQEAAVYHTAGALQNGRRIWILAKLPETIRVIGDDITDKYLLLSNSHDGHGAVQIKFTPIRVVCHNTLTMALNYGPTLRVAHTRDMHVRLKQAERLLGIVHKQYDDLAETFQHMTRVQISGDDLAAYYRTVFPDPPNPDDDAGFVRVKRDRLLAEALFADGVGADMPGVPGTLWAAYNGVTEYIDHRPMQTTADGRLNAIWFGTGYLAKARAFRAAVDRLEPASAN